MADPANKQYVAAYYRRHKQANGHAVARERQMKDRVAIGKDKRGRVVTQKGPGKPKAKIDVEQLKQLVRAGSPMWEIAQRLHVHKDTLQQEEWMAHIMEARADRNISLRVLQWQSAREGNIHMQMFLGEQWLGQHRYGQWGGADPDGLSAEDDAVRRLEIVFIDSDGDGRPRKYQTIEAMPDDDGVSTLPQLADGKP